MMDVLLTFTGFHDPYFKGLVDQEEQPGPTNSTHHHDELTYGIRKLRGIADVIIVSRPGEWKNGTAL